MIVKWCAKVAIYSVLAMPGPAFASGGVWCTATNADLDFHFEASVPHDTLSAWFGIGGTIDTRSKELPAELARFEITDAELPLRWLDRDSVRLKIEKSISDAKSYAAVHLTVIASAVDEADYRGGYNLMIEQLDGKTVTKTGALACSAD
jgi:hypothetical protein